MKSQEIKVDVRISVLKPLHSSWITKFYDYMYIRTNPDIIIKGWRKSGIVHCLENKATKEGPFE